MKDKTPESFEGRLPKEVDAWHTSGIITQEQKEKILKFYLLQNRQLEHGERSGKLISTLTVLGAVLLGIGVILFFASNWQAIPKSFKLVIIFGSLIATYYIGYRLEFEQKNYPRVGRALIFLGSILFGAAIWLIAQIFHINSHYPNGVLFWALGIISIAWLCRSQAILILAAFLLSIWTVMEQGNFNTSNYLYPILVLGLLLPTAYQIKSRISVAVSMLGMYLWLGMSGSQWLEGFNRTELPIVLILMVFGFLIYEVGVQHLNNKQIKFMQLPYRFIGLLGVMFTNYILTFHMGGWYYGGYKEVDWLSSAKFLFPFTALLALVIAVILYNFYHSKENVAHKYEHFITLAFLAIINICALNPYLILNEILYLPFNIILFSLIIGLLIMGYKKADMLLINLSLFFFVIDVISRYFDYFWELMPRSIFFMIGGIMLLAGGTFLERSRRKLLQEVKGDNYVS